MSAWLHRIDGYPIPRHLIAQCLKVAGDSRTRGHRISNERTGLANGMGGDRREVGEVEARDPHPQVGGGHVEAGVDDPGAADRGADLVIETAQEVGAVDPGVEEVAVDPLVDEDPAEEVLVEGVDPRLAASRTKLTLSRF